MSAGVLSYLRHLVPTTGLLLRDDELLECFAAGRQPDAFTELLRRHGPLVWGVCRRVLGDAHAAEDAFQATFLQLAQKAAALRGKGSLAGWLHTVATRLARRAWLAEQRRRRRERQRPAPPQTLADEMTWRELRQVLDAEINRLPELYRQPLILCYLENRPQREAALVLGLAPGVLRGRLDRGREKLRQRLQKLGLPLAAAVLLSRSDRVPAALCEATGQLVRQVLAGGLAPSGVAALTAGGARLARLKIGVVLAVLLVAGGIGIGGAARKAGPRASPPSPPGPAQPRDNVKATEDPLPPGAIRRLGTARQRVHTWHSLPDGKSYLALHPVKTAEIRRIDSGTDRILETWPVLPPTRLVGFSPDGRHALMASDWIFSTGARVPGQKESRQCVVQLYDLARRRAVWRHQQALEQKDWKQVHSAYFSADGKWIVTASQVGGGPLRLWDGADGKELWRHGKPGDSLEPLGFTAGGAALVLRDGINQIHLLDRASGKRLRSFATMPRGQTWQCTLAPDGSAVLIAAGADALRIWDVTTGRERARRDEHKNDVYRFACSPDSKLLVSGAGGSSVRIHAWPSGAVVRTLELGRVGVLGMAVSPDSRRLEVLFGGEQGLHFYDLKTGAALPIPGEGHKGGVWGVAVAPEGRLLSFARDGTVRTWDVATGKAVGRLAVEKDQSGGGFALSSDGRLLAVPASDNRRIDVVERATGKRLHRLEAGTSVGNHLAFSPDGRWLAGADPLTRAVQVWDVATGRGVLSLRLEVLYGIITCTFSPDGRRFAAADHGMVRLYDTATWKEQTGLPASAPLGLAYSPDGRTLATASTEGIRLFEVATRQQRACFGTDGHPRGSLRFSARGRWLAWRSDLKTHVWDTQRGQLLASFQGHDDAVTDLAFTPDERTLVSASQDSTLLVWDLAAAEEKKPPPPPGDVEQAWRRLDSEAQQAYEAIRVLASSPDATVKLLSRHLEPSAPIDARRIDAWLRDLESDAFDQRERATRRLEQLGNQAVPALERLLADQPSLEARQRAERLLRKASDRSPGPERLRQIRAVEALERMGGAGARRLLEALAEGAPDSGLTRDARAALGRLRR
jgi:RNA polymerase sigma factor (sigma-70 family)